MTSPKQVLKSGIGPKLVPFFKTVAIYFVIFIPRDEPSVFGAVLKALPILSLIAFVLLHGMSFGDEYFYSRRILLGLLCSVVGDVLLVWDHLFLHGLCVFLIAQIFYISAFGFKPLNLLAAAVIFSTTSIVLFMITRNSEGALKIGVIVYSFVLMTMVWRAVSRVRLFEELWTWTKLCSCVGGILFAFSDACIGVNHFYMPIPYAQIVIMTTYYAAQLGISLSVVDCKASYLDSLKNQQKETASLSSNIPLSNELLDTEHSNPVLGYEAASEVQDADCQLNMLCSSQTLSELKKKSELSSLMSSTVLNTERHKLCRELVSRRKVRSGTKEKSQCFKI